MGRSYFVRRHTDWAYPRLGDHNLVVWYDQGVVRRGTLHEATSNDLRCDAYGPPRRRRRCGLLRHHDGAHLIIPPEFGTDVLVVPDTNEDR
jgi:hypothetical protein